MHGRTAGEEANLRPLATPPADRYDEAGVNGPTRCNPNGSLPDAHRGANETMSYRVLFFVLTAFLAGSPFSLADERKLPLLLKEDFEHGFSRWKTTDPNPAKKSVWKIIEVGPKGNHALRCT